MPNDTKVFFCIASLILAFLLGALVERKSSNDDFLEVDYVSQLGIAVVHNKLTNQITCYRQDQRSEYVEEVCTGYVPKEN